MTWIVGPKSCSDRTWVRLSARMRHKLDSSYVTVEPEGPGGLSRKNVRRKLALA